MTQKLAYVLTRSMQQEVFGCRSPTRMATKPFRRNVSMYHGSKDALRKMAKLFVE